MKNAVVVGAFLLAAVLNLSAANAQSYWGYVNEGFGINAYSPFSGSNTNVWSWSMWDEEQIWIWEGDNLRRSGTSYCLNAYNPSVGSNVNMWSCSQSDSDQHWDLVSTSGGTYFLIQKIGTNLCLNAHNRFNGGNLNLWSCDYTDPDQRFKQILYYTQFQEGQGSEVSAVIESPNTLLWPSSYSE